MCAWWYLVVGCVFCSVVVGGIWLWFVVVGCGDCFVGRSYGMCRLGVLLFTHDRSFISST